MVPWQRMANFLTFLAYEVLGVVLIWNRALLRQFLELRYATPAVVIWGSFIALCGWTHLMDWWIFERPMYRLDTVVRTLTAIASVAAVFTVPVLLRAFQASSARKFELEHTSERFRNVIHRMRISPDLRDEVLQQLEKELL